MRKDSDCDKVLNLLKDGNWWNVLDIMRIIKPGCINWACRSRISELNSRGYNIVSRKSKENKCFEYRLVNSVQQG